MAVQYATKRLEANPALSIRPEAASRPTEFAAKRAAKVTPPSES
jgi:hypothetical protein